MKDMEATVAEAVPAASTDAERVEAARRGWSRTHILLMTDVASHAVMSALKAEAPSNM